MRVLSRRSGIQLQALLFAFAIMVFCATPGYCIWPFGNDDGPPKIAVISETDLLVPGMNDMPAGKVLPGFIADRIMDHLSRSKRFTVIEKAVLHRIVQERGQAKQTSTMSAIIELLLQKTFTTEDPLFSQLREIGIAAEADYMLIGALEKIGVETTTTSVPGTNLSFTKGSSNARLRMRLVKVENASIAGVIDLELSRPIDFSKTPDNASQEFLETLSRIGAARVLDELYPAKIVASGQTLALTRGANEDVRTGDLFEILRPGPEVRDGAIPLGTIDSPVGSVRVTSVQGTMSIVEQVSGEPVAEGDVARAMQPAAKDNPKNGEAAPAYQGKRLQADKNASGDKFHIAVGRFRIESPSAAIRNWLEGHITGDLVVKLQNTRRFVVAEREDLSQITDEMLMQASTKGTPLESLVSGLGSVDYILTGSLRTLAVKAKVENIPFVNETKVGDAKGVTEAVVRIVDTHTGQLVSAEKIAFSHPLETEESLSRFLDQFSNEVTRRVMLGLFPIKVMAAGSDGTVYINRGSDGGIATGQEYEVFRPGQELRDPDTGLLLGTAETPVGRIRIGTVDNAKAQAQALSGSGFLSGDIVRPAKAAAKKTSKPQAAPQPAVSW